MNECKLVCPVLCGLICDVCYSVMCICYSMLADLSVAWSVMCRLPCYHQFLGSEKQTFRFAVLDFLNPLPSLPVRIQKC